MRRGCWSLITQQSHAWRAVSLRRGAAHHPWPRAAVHELGVGSNVTRSSQFCRSVSGIWPCSPRLLPALHPSAASSRSSRCVAAFARRIADAAADTASAPPGTASAGAESSMQAASQGSDVPVKRRRKRKAEPTSAEASEDAVPPLSDAAGRRATSLDSATAQVCGQHTSDIAHLAGVTCQCWRGGSVVVDPVHACPDLTAGAPPLSATDVWSGVRRWVVFSDLHVSAKCGTSVCTYPAHARLFGRPHLLPSEMLTVPPILFRVFTRKLRRIRQLKLIC
jgi:hypothetical protein